MKEIEKIIRLEELRLQDKMVKAQETEDGWFDHYKDDPDWLQNWNSEIMNILADIDKEYKTAFGNEFYNVQKEVSINWGNDYKVSECINNSKKCLEEIIEKIKKL